jgi:amino acid adenylation domain-containing protein
MSNRAFPVSFPQQRLLFLDRLDPGSTAYNLARVIRIVGELNAPALTKTFQSIVQRHSSLRTKFMFGMEGSYQIVEDEIPFSLATIDLSSIQPADRENQALKISKEEAHKSFDLSVVPLFRAVLIHLNHDEHFLLLVMHHIITDGWSMSILFKEIGELYAAAISGSTHAPLPAPEIQYVDFARWQQEHYTPTTLERQIAYWTSRLKDHRGFIDLPADYARPSFQSHEGAIATLQISKQLAARLADIAEKHNATQFMVLLAAVYVLLWRYTGDEDILVGTPVAGRSEARFENLVGLFVNTLVVRGDCSGNPSFLEMLRRTCAAALDAFDHQDAPFEKLIEALNPTRSQSYSPLFQVMFVFHNAPKQRLGLPGLTLQELEFDSGTAKFDLSIEVTEQDGALDFRIEYCTALFKRHTIFHLTRHLETLLKSIGNNPDGPIADLPILDEESRNQLVLGFNSTTAQYHRNTRIEELFAQQVAQTPHRIALIEDRSMVTYESLSKKANAIANQLTQLGLSQQQPVGVYMDRSIDAVVACLAALQANTPYVPLDVANPKHRLELIIQDAGCNVVLTHRQREKELPATVRVISLDEAIAPDDISIAAAEGRTSKDLAYIIYTSGSTGRPKGVKGSHRAAINRFEWMWRTYPFRQGEKCCQKTALGFVDSVWETFGPLLAGVCTVIVPDDQLFDPYRFVSLLEKHEVTRIVLVPSLLRTLLDVVPNLASRLSKLKLWTTSGESLYPDLVRKFRVALPEATLLNIYGSSEVTADVTCHEIDRDTYEAIVPIGRPINNTQIFILDRYRNLVPPLVRGEIHVGGDCLSEGYWQQPDLTASRYIPNPYSPDKSPFVFATGDFGRILHDGTIEYLGRRDDQIKLRGIRIEYGEIEANLQTHPQVRYAAVSVHGHSPDTQVLLAHFEARSFDDSLPDELRDFLRLRLPEYMVPASFIRLDHMPLLPSGKINRLALPKSGIRVRHRVHLSPRDDNEKRLHAIWREVLNIDQISIDDNFFDLGGHSLSAMRVLARVRRDFHLDLSIRRIFESPTIAGVAQELEKMQRAGDTTSNVRPGSNTSALLSVLRDELKALPPDQLNDFLQSVLADKNAGNKND